MSFITVTLARSFAPFAIAGMAAAATWPAGLRVERTGELLHAGTTYSSSSALRIRWTPPEAAVHHYIVTASDGRSERRIEVRAGRQVRFRPRNPVPVPATDLTLENLKAATTYTVAVRACLDAACGNALDSSAAGSNSTEEEFWRIQGTGNSYATANRLVPDGNVGSYAFRYGPWAGPDIEGRVQLYYVPLDAREKGVKIGESIVPGTATMEAASSFRGVSGYGLLQVCQPRPGLPGSPPVPDPACSNTNSLVTGVALFQAIPLAPNAGAKVRLYFEAAGFDGRTRIFYLDSHDGYLGRDFHAGIATICSTLADYSPGGACEPTLAIGVDLDGARGNPNLRNARQFKVGYPVLDSSAWDMAPGTFMWFTTEWPDGRCSSYGFNAAYAVWDGERWVVQYGANGCPKLLAGVQAPMPVHLGGARYKLYFNRHRLPGGPTNPLTTLKPMQMIYADPERSGDPATVDFDDWESVDDAREIHYLWPDGSRLTADEESRLDDYAIFSPAKDRRQLLMYSNMSQSGASAAPFIGSVVLVNP